MPYVDHSNSSFFSHKPQLFLHGSQKSRTQLKGFKLFFQDIYHNLITGKVFDPFYKKFVQLYQIPAVKLVESKYGSVITLLFIISNGFSEFRLFTKYIK